MHSSVITSASCDGATHLTVYGAHIVQMNSSPMLLGNPESSNVIEWSRLEFFFSESARVFTVLFG